MEEYIDTVKYELEMHRLSDLIQYRKSIMAEDIPKEEKEILLEGMLRTPEEESLIFA